MHPFLTNTQSKQKSKSKRHQKKIEKHESKTPFVAQGTLRAPFGHHKGTLLKFLTNTSEP